MSESKKLILLIFTIILFSIMVTLAFTKAHFEKQKGELIQEYEEKLEEREQEEALDSTEGVVKFDEESVEVDYTAAPEEILAKYTEEGMRLFKMNFPDTLTMNYALKNIGKEPTEIKGKTLDGEDISLSELDGKKVILSFAKTTCSICKEMVPVLQSIQSKHEDVVFLNIFPLDDNKSIQSFYKEFNIDVPSMTLSIEDNKELKTTAIDNYKVEQVPTYVFIDEFGKISYTYIGNKDEVLFEEMITRAFEEEKLYDYLRTIRKQVDKNGNEIKKEKLIDGDSSKK